MSTIECNEKDKLDLSLISYLKYKKMFYEKKFGFMSITDTREKVYNMIVNSSLKELNENSDNKLFDSDVIHSKDYYNNIQQIFDKYKGEQDYCDITFMKNIFKGLGNYIFNQLDDFYTYFAMIKPLIHKKYGLYIQANTLIIKEKNNMYTFSYH